MGNTPQCHHGTCPEGQPGHADANVIVKPYLPDGGISFLFRGREPEQLQIHCLVCDDGSWDEVSPPRGTDAPWAVSSKERA